MVPEEFECPVCESRLNASLVQKWRDQLKNSWDEVDVECPECRAELVIYTDFDDVDDEDAEEILRIDTAY